MSHAIDLRRRARRLRDLASRIERSPVLSLERAAGTDTWRGHRPTLCVSLLHSNQAQLHREVDRLRWQAYLFERRAAELDAAATRLLGA